MEQQQPIYPMHGPAQLAQDQNVDPAQIILQLQQALQGMNDLQQQVISLQTQVQQQHAQQATQVPLVTLQTSLEALATAQQEQFQLQQQFQSGIQEVIQQLANRQPTASARATVPTPLSPKFKADDKEMPFSVFRAKMSTAIERFPESLHTEREKINYAVLSMDGIPSKFVAPYINGTVNDDDGILRSYDKFMDTLEELYGDQTQVEETSYRLQRLRQTGLMIDYITTFKELSSRLRWNEPALVARFKDGLSDEIKQMLAAQWHSLQTLKATQAAATTAYQNLQSQTRFRGRLHKPATPLSRKPYTTVQTPSTSGPTPMDLDTVKVRRLTPDEKQRRREQGLCLYCGGKDHFALSCPLKKGPQVAVVAVDSENVSA